MNQQHLRQICALSHVSKQARWLLVALVVGVAGALTISPRSSAGGPLPAANGAPPPAKLLVRPAPTAVVPGWVAAWDDLRFDALVRIWPTLHTAPTPGTLGGPRAGLNWRTLIDFYDGRLAFMHTFTVEEGLGPRFNDVSCAACHSHPAIGGGGRDMKQGITVHGPPWTQGDAMGLRKHAIPGFQRAKAAGKTAQLRTPPLFGLGLLDLVPESARKALEDPKDSNGDGIRGVRAFRSGNRIKKPARFGQKSNDWNLRTFLAGAMVDEMGVTNTVRREPRGDSDKAADPEVSTAFVLRVDAYVRNLAAPSRGPITPAVKAGEAIFSRLNCVGCHRPQLGPTRGAYTDLLLHDMGPLLDSGLKDGSATGAQWRTAPLWGLRHRTRYLHDERAGSIDEVLAFHQGEATGPATNYRALTKADKAALHIFLGSL